MLENLVSYQLVTTIAWVLGYIALSQMIQKLLGVAANDKDVPFKRAYYVKAYFRFLLLIGFIIGLALIWSVDFRGLLVFASSIFAVVGVALFAQWSILSNITASIVIFFSVPNRIGDRVRILDGDNTVTATITDITLFYTVLVDDEGQLVSFPNNLILQRPIVRVAQPQAEQAPLEEGSEVVN